MKVLFIGGIEDGKKVDVADPTPSYFRVKSPLTGVVYVYRIELWRTGPDDILPVYVHEPLSSADAFRLLLHFYRPTSQ